MSSTDATVIGGAPPPAGDAPAIDGVVIERELGRGGMGAVWLGRQTYLDRAVAVKALTIAGDEAFAERFRREARILAGLQHPHIVACHQAGIAPDGRPFLVMEFVDGPDLRKLLASNGALPPAEAARLVAEVAEGLRHAHRQGIIHRDVKPENVLLASAAGGALVAKLADLGLARTQRAAGASGLTAAGQIVGTPATMAPEQFDDPEGVDHRADIYGLGCVLHAALTGKPAFSGTTFAELVASKVHGPPPDPSRLRADLPRELTALCRRMLARGKDERPDYDEVIAALRAAGGTSAHRSRGPWLWLVAAVVAVAVVAVVAMSRPAPTEPTSAPAKAPAPAAPAPAPVAAPAPAPVPAIPRLSVAQELFGPAFATRLAGWNVADPLNWGASEEQDGYPVAGRSGEIVRSLPELPGRIVGTVVVPPTARQVRIGVRDADGRTTSLLLLPIGGLIASLNARLPDGSDAGSAGSATAVELTADISLTLTPARLVANIAGAAIPTPLVMDLPAPPRAVVLAAESDRPVLFTSLRAEP